MREELKPCTVPSNQITASIIHPMDIKNLSNDANARIDCSLNNVHLLKYSSNTIVEHRALKGKEREIKRQRGREKLYAHFNVYCFGMELVTKKDLQIVCPNNHTNIVSDH